MDYDQAYNRSMSTTWKISPRGLLGSIYGVCFNRSDMQNGGNISMNYIAKRPTTLQERVEEKLEPLIFSVLPRGTQLVALFMLTTSLKNVERNYRIRVRQCNENGAVSTTADLKSIEDLGLFDVIGESQDTYGSKSKHDLCLPADRVGQYACRRLHQQDTPKKMPWREGSIEIPIQTLTWGNINCKFTN